MSVYVQDITGVPEGDYKLRVATNPAHLLMEMDFGKVIQTPGALKKLQSAQPETPDDFEKALKGIDGIKVETKPEVAVTLK